MPFLTTNPAGMQTADANAVNNGVWKRMETGFQRSASVTSVGLRKVRMI
jgi:hypothetical protein